MNIKTTTKMKNIICAFMLLASLQSNAQNNCEYSMRQKNGKVFTAVDAPCGLRVGDTFKGHTVIKVFIPSPRRDPNHWTPNAKYVSSAKTAKQSYQCWGTRKDGQRCTRKVSTDHGLCYQHAAQK